MGKIEIYHKITITDGVYRLVITDETFDGFDMYGEKLFHDGTMIFHSTLKTIPEDLKKEFTDVIKLYNMLCEGNNGRQETLFNQTD